MEQSTGSVIKVRPAFLEIAQPSFVPQVVSSPANIFQQEVLAQSYTKDRITWQFRSPSANLLCSPMIFGVMRIKISTPYKLSKSQQIGPLLGVYDTGTAALAATLNARDIALSQKPRVGYGFRPMFAFSSGNAVMNACESKSISINGGNWSALNENLYLRSLDECYVPRNAQQRAWSTCGGCQNFNDSVPTSGHVLGLPSSVAMTARTHGLVAGSFAAIDIGDGAGNTAQGVRNSLLVVAHGAAGDQAIAGGFCPTEGASMDLGLVRRMNNFYDQIIGVTDMAAAAQGRVYKLEIKFPISGSVWNDQWGAQGLSRSDPRLRLALGLPHINSCQIVLQFKELFKTLIRRLGRPNAEGAAVGDQAIIGAVSGPEDVKIEFDSTYPPRLRVQYIRLPSWRSYPQTSVLQIYKREIRRPTGTRAAGDFGAKVFNSGLWGGGGVLTAMGLRCSEMLTRFLHTMWFARVLVEQLIQKK